MGPGCQNPQSPVLYDVLGDLPGDPETAEQASEDHLVPARPHARGMAVKRCGTGQIRRWSVHCKRCADPTFLVLISSASPFLVSFWNGDRHGRTNIAGFVAQMAWGDSSCESSVIAWADEQTEHADLQDPELARLQQGAQASGLADDPLAGRRLSAIAVRLVRPGDELGGCAHRQAGPSARL